MPSFYRSASSQLFLAAGPAKHPRVPGHSAVLGDPGLDLGPPPGAVPTGEVRQVILFCESLCLRPLPKLESCLNTYTVIQRV